MHDGGKLGGSRLGVREEEAVGYLGEGITDGFRFVGQCNGEVSFELGD